MKFDYLVYGLLEGTSPLRTLYHNTGLDRIGEIIKSNSFICGDNPDDLSYHHGADNSAFKKFPYYMSAARTPNNRFAKSLSGIIRNSVSLELDASKLSDHGYIIKPINFFVSNEEKESEDRVLSKKEIINNFDQYIKAFHVYINPIYISSLTTDDPYADSINKYRFNYAIKTILDTKKPAYVYKTRDEFHSMNKVKREPLSDKHLIS